MNYKEKIEEIQRKAYFMARTDVYGDHPDGIHCLKEVFNDILSLIQQEREKAVREFAEWIDREEKRSYEDTIRLEQVYRFLKESEGK